MKNILIITDLDGTLIHYKTFEFKSIVPYIDELTSKGVKIVPSSSKCFEEIKYINRDLGLSSVFIVENGSAIYFLKKVFANKPKNSEEIGDYWRIKLGIDRKNIQTILMKNNFKKFLKYILFLRNMTRLQQSYYTGLKPDTLDISLKKEFSEPLIWMGTNSDLDEFANSLNEEGISINKGAKLLHLTGLTNKGDAMLELIKQLETAKYFNNEKENLITTIAIGDSFNDKPMLELADYALLIKVPNMKTPQLRKTDNVYHSEKIAPLGWKQTLQEIDIVKNLY